MFTQTRSGAVLVITCTRCSQQHHGNDTTARAFKRNHTCLRRTTR